MNAPAANPRHSSESNEHYTPSEIVEAARRVLGGFDLDPASSDRANSLVRAKTIYTAPGATIPEWRHPEIVSAEGGFTRPWHGRVFLNPPGGSCDEAGIMLRKHPDKPGSGPLTKGWFRTTDSLRAKGQSAQKAWWFKLAREWAEGRVKAAIFVCFSVELLQTTQNDTPRFSQTSAVPLPIPLDFPICFPRSRIDYLKQNAQGELVPGGAPPHASAIVLLPHVTQGMGHHKHVRAFHHEFSALGRCIEPDVATIAWRQVSEQAS